MGKVTEELVEIIKRQVAERGIVVWYDPRRTYVSVIQRLDMPDTTILRFEDGFFRLREKLEPFLEYVVEEGGLKLDADQPPSVIVYVPMAREESGYALIEAETAGVVQIANEALAAAERLDTAVDVWRQQADVPAEIEQTVNGTLKGLSRILVPLGGTVAGTYGQDPYGLSAQSTLLPGLYDLTRMNSLPAQAEEREMLFRELIRQRNRLADSMREARDLANQTAATIGK